MNKPTKPGYYWFKGNLNTQYCTPTPYDGIVYLRVSQKHIFVNVIKDPGDYLLNYVDGEWSELTEGSRRR